MAEKRIEVRTIMVRLMCDKCGEGEMKPTGVALMSHPPQYPHKCDKCGAETTIRGGKTYPRMEYEEVTPNSSAQPAPSVPEGWKLVPIEPTPEMIDAAEYVDWGDADVRGSCINAWRRMLAAAPEAKP